MRFHYIYAFHMPLFFFLSGYLYRAKDNCSLRTFVNKKFKSLIIPYVTFSIISIWLYCTFVNTSLQVLKTFWFANRLEMGGATPYNTSLWFLPSLFFVEIIYYAIDKMCINKKLKIAIVVVLSLAGFMLTQKELVLPMSLDWTMYYLLYYAAGNLFRQQSDRIVKFFEGGRIGKYALLCIILNLLPAVTVNTKYSLLFSGKYYSISIIVAFAGIVLFCTIARILCKFGNIKNFFMYFGCNSLIVLVLHTPLRDYGVSPIIWGITGQFYATEWIRWVYILGSLVLCALFIQIINTCFPWMLGKTDKK